MTKYERCGSIWRRVDDDPGPVAKCVGFVMLVILFAAMGRGCSNSAAGLEPLATTPALEVLE